VHIAAKYQTTPITQQEFAFCHTVRTKVKPPSYRLKAQTFPVRFFSFSTIDALVILFENDYALLSTGIFSLAWTISISTVSIGSSTTLRLIENIFGLSKSLVQSGHA